MFRVISLTFVLALVTATAASAQTTPWGDPDLQGVWSNQTPVLAAFASGYYIPAP